MDTDGDDEKPSNFPHLVAGLLDGSMLSLVVGLVMGCIWGATLSVWGFSVLISLAGYLIGLALDGLLRALLSF